MCARAGMRHACPEPAYRLARWSSVSPDRRGGLAAARRRLRRDPHVPVADRQARLRVLLRRRDAAAGPLRVERRQRPRGHARRDAARASGSRSPTRSATRRPRCSPTARRTKFGQPALHVAHAPASRAGARARATASPSPSTSSGCSEPWPTTVGLRLRRGLEGHARPARRQGRERRRDDPRARRRPRARPGFTITTEACVAYMKADQEEPDGMAEQVAEALERLQEHTGKQLGDDEDPLLVSVRSGARESMPGMLDTVLNLGLNDTSVEGLARATENERFAWDSYRRFVQMFGNVTPRHRRRGVREGDHRTSRTTRGVEEDTELDVDALKELDRPLQGALQGAHRRGLPAGPAGAAAARDPRGLRLLDRRPRAGVPAHQPHPGRLGHRGQRPADGLRQQGRHVGLRRRLQPRRGHRRARAERRLPAQRPGRGRRLRRAHAARHRRDEGLAARRPRAADGHPPDAREALRGHAGHRVHGGGGAALHAPDAQRQAARPRPRCASRATPSTRGCSTATRR